MGTWKYENTADAEYRGCSGDHSKWFLGQRRSAAGLGDSGTVIDLTGCSLENVLYEISAQRAVIAKTGADSSVVIVGYDQYNTWLLDPATGEVSPYGMNDSTALFQQQEMSLFPILITKNKFNRGQLMLSKSITKLVQYGMETGLVAECEKNYTINLLLDVFHEDEYVEPEESFSDVDLEETLNELLDEAVKRGLIEDSVVYRDLFDTRLMNCLMPRPAQVQKEFWDKYQNSPQEATDYFYKLSQDSNYIRRYRVKKDQNGK